DAPEPIAHLTELHSATEVMRAYRNGAIDIAALTLDEALVLASEGPDVAVFLVVDLSAGGDALVARADIATPAALAGRRIGLESSALGAYMLSRVYDRSELAPGAAEIVEIAYGDHARAFRRGEVDAVITFDPVRAELVAGGARELFSSREIPGEIVDVLLARPSYLEANRAAVARLVAAWQAAVTHVRRSPETAFARLDGFVAGDRARFDAALAGIELPTPAQQRRLLRGELAAVAERLTGVMRQHDLLGASRGEFAITTAVFERALP
ncbi:MAG: ABC transporter substrate-binding protein, partial [Gammaproteobacteria bacterium]